jgi:hypothetical protein
MHALKYSVSKTALSTGPGHAAQQPTGLPDVNMAHVETGAAYEPGSVHKIKLYTTEQEFLTRSTRCEISSLDAWIPAIGKLCPENAAAP